MCGLLGFSGDPKIIDKSVAKAILAKLKILGLYNIERGKHSCGMFIDSELFKGVKDDKLFSDFIQNNELPLPGELTDNYVVIGHTRQATSGDHTIENAHPFMIDNEFVLAHNGVIRNIWGLCNKYKVNHAGIKVDSLGLAHLIHREGFKVLNEYQGFAALLMHKMDEPNSLYMYRGVSKTWSGAEETEERPLYYMQSEEGIYISSLEKSLLAITESSSDKIKLVEGNIVHKITNGKMTKSKFPVTRDTVNYGVNANNCGSGCSVNHNVKKQGVGAPTTNIGASNSGGVQDGTTTNSRVGGTTPNPSNSHSQNFADAFKIVPLIFHETLPSRLDKYTGVNGVFYHLGRYWILEGDEIVVAHGEYYINKKGVVKQAKGKDNNNYYFYEGVLIRNEKCWNSLQNDPLLKDRRVNFAMAISLYSEYPVCNSRSDVNARCLEVGDYAKYRWYHNQKMCGNTGFTPKWSDRNYTIREGLTHSIAAQGTLIKTETCVDNKSLAAERASKEISVSPKTQAPVVPMLPPAIDPKQGRINFSEPTEQDLTNFYRVYDNLEHAITNLSTDEIRAIRYYVADVMMQEMSIDPITVYDDIVDVQFNMFLTMCCDNFASISEMWDDKSYQDIPHYLMVAENNPDGEIFDNKLEGIKKAAEAQAMHFSTGEANETCEVVLKPKEETAPIVEIDTLPERAGFSRILSGDSDELPFDGDSIHDDEVPIIDMAIEREMASVPTEDIDYIEVEEVFPNEEKQYAFEDIVDFLSDTRETADDLVRFEDDDFAQEVANLVYRNVDPLLKNLEELCENHKQSGFGDYLAKRMKKTVGL